MQPFTKNVIDIVGTIPPGRVMSYGQVATAAGNGRAARQVVRVLHTISQKYKLPWHRVINAKGEISFTAKDQRVLLEAEGVEFNLNGKVDFATYRWFPPDAEEN